MLLFADKIEWYLDEKKIKTKYNNAGLFTTELKVKNLIGKNLKFNIIGMGGEAISKNFEIFFISLKGNIVVDKNTYENNFENIGLLES